MHKKGGKLWFSPSDLTRYMDSPFASWMDRYALEYPDKAPDQDPPDPLMSLLQKKGYEHEDATESSFAQQGLAVCKIEGGSNEDKLKNTLAAMRSGKDVIVQARLQKGSFAGYADFLIKVANHSGSSSLGQHHYEVWDTKLANRIKPTFVIQLCCYAEMLEDIQGICPETITVALGNGDRKTLKTIHFFDYYLNLKASFLETQEQFDPEKPPKPEDSASWANWSVHAEALLDSKDHLLKVANITRGQIKKLNRADIHTTQALAQTELNKVPGIISNIFDRIKNQAAIQQRSAGQATPEFKILPHPQGEKIGLALLPPHSKLDVFFDIEGFPIVEGGLEYLWGCTYFDEADTRQFRDFWAHDQEQEKSAFVQFIDWVYGRWEQDHHMHIYHYASYEITACRKLMGRYGVCEDQVDQLLRNEVFVDLYKIVRGGVLIGEPSYSIKNVEHLYRDQRKIGVDSGADSVVVYEGWRERYARGEEGGDWQSSKTLKDIRDYNIDDCDSAQELTEWLREQQRSNNIAWLDKAEVVEPKTDKQIANLEQIAKLIEMRDRLLEVASKQEPERASITRNLAWMLEFHRREAKPVFWRLFERLGLAHIELIDDLDCLACCERTAKEPFKPTPRARNLAYEYRFDATQEFRGIKGDRSQFYLLGVDTEDGKTAKVSYLADHSDLAEGLIVVQTAKAPPDLISMIPDELVSTSIISKAIEKVVSDYETNHLNGEAEKSPAGKTNAIIAFLSRAQPALKDRSFKAIAPDMSPEERLQEIIKIAASLDNSYLTIQGPPGTGKSFTAVRIITELLRSDCKIGISSNSHKAINHLLLGTARHCRELGVDASFHCSKNTDPDLEKYQVKIISNPDMSDLVASSSVFGTTAWGFSRDDMEAKLDYLFVDEAGQVSVANLVGMSRSARNLVLLGDQMQLGQPSQGAHPGESGLSILDFLLKDQATIPENMGVFLNKTYRMHPKLNQFISEQFYEAKLKAHPDTSHRVIRVPDNYQGLLNTEAGIVFVPVLHEGNTQSSSEEVAVIKQLVGELLGRQFVTGDQSGNEGGGLSTRAININDILFVAPYNHQVSKLTEALGQDARVGSVDKFQGQEAPIVILSMCTSDASESPRGLDFLFNKQRINVAISRAQSLAIVVGNPEIGRAPVSHIDQLRKVSLYSALSRQLHGAAD